MIKNTLSPSAVHLRVLDGALSVCRLEPGTRVFLEGRFHFLAQTDDELSLVCLTEDVPERTQRRSDGWRGFRIEGELDFSLIGILSRLSAILAENGIGIFAVSTYNTDYILVKQENLERALNALSEAGYSIR